MSFITKFKSLITKTLTVNGNATVTGSVTGDNLVYTNSNQTIGGNKTLSGQLQLTGQSATDANSALTRGLMDTRLAQLESYFDYIAADTGAQVTNSTTLVDSGLELVLPVGTYLLDIRVTAYSITSNNGGWKFYYNVSGGSVAQGIQFNMAGGGNGLTANATSVNFERSTGNIASSHMLYSGGVIIVTGATTTFKIQHALNATDAAVPARGIRAGSYIKAIRIN